MDNKQNELLIDLFFHLQSTTSILTELKDESIKDRKLNQSISSLKTMLNTKVAKVSKLFPEMHRYYANMDMVFRALQEFKLEDKLGVNMDRELLYDLLAFKEMKLNGLVNDYQEFLEVKKRDAEIKEHLSKQNLIEQADDASN